MIMREAVEQRIAIGKTLLKLVADGVTIFSAFEISPWRAGISHAIETRVVPPMLCTGKKCLYRYQDPLGETLRDWIMRQGLLRSHKPFT